MHFIFNNGVEVTNNVGEKFFCFRKMKLTEEGSDISSNIKEGLTKPKAKSQLQTDNMAVVSESC